MPSRSAIALAFLLSLSGSAALSLASADPPLLTGPVEFAAVQALSARPPDSQWRYGTESSHQAFLWLPDKHARPAPVVVLLHGGCWLAEYSVDHIYPLASALARAGYAVWAPEYRRVGESGGGWPGTFEDVAASIDFLAALETEDLDLEQVVLTGHSAGGHLALWAAARTAQTRVGGEPRIQALAAIGLDAITDLVSYAAGSNSCEQIVPELLGGTPAQRPERYRQASPAALAPVAPVYLLQGKADTIVAQAQARALPTAEVTLISDAGHFDLIHPGTTAFPALLELLGNLTSRPD